MRTDALQTISYWLFSALVYPGVLLGAALALVGEAALAGFRPLLAPRPFRGPRRHRALLQPLYDFLKLTGRTPAASVPFAANPTRGNSEMSQAVLGGVAAVAPILAIALMPFPGNLLQIPLGLAGDLLTVTLLIAVQPLCATMIATSGGSRTVDGATAPGRFATGLLPVLLGIAALIEVQGSHTGTLAAIQAAPETGAQALVRLLVGVALLVALPWWCERGGALLQSAGGYASVYLQRAGVAAFWAIIVLPLPGEPLWAAVAMIAGALFAYVAMWLIRERLARGARSRDEARMVWIGAVPVAALAMLAALWQGAQ